MNEEYAETLRVLDNILETAERWADLNFRGPELIATEREWALMLKAFGVHPNHGAVPGDSLVVYGLTVRRMGS